MIDKVHNCLIQYYISFNSRTMSENRQIDLGSLTLFDYNSIPKGDTPQETTENITSALVENVKFIYKHLIELKKQEASQLEKLPEEEQIHDFTISQNHLKIPEPQTVFPRSRRLPEERELTKWEKFAKQKGIKKRKKAGMSFDSELNKKVARWGRNSKKNTMDIPIMEEKQPGRNPFEDVKAEKQLKQYRQKLKQEKNKIRGKK